jgi:hypothetical protein
LKDQKDFYLSPFCLIKKDQKIKACQKFDCLPRNRGLDSKISEILGGHGDPPLQVMIEISSSASRPVARGKTANFIMAVFKNPGLFFASLRLESVASWRRREESFQSKFRNPHSKIELLREIKNLLVGKD